MILYLLKKRGDSMKLRLLLIVLVIILTVGCSKVEQPEQIVLESDEDTPTFH